MSTNKFLSVFRKDHEITYCWKSKKKNKKKKTFYISFYVLLQLRFNNIKLINYRKKTKQTRSSNCFDLVLIIFSMLNKMHSFSFLNRIWKVCFSKCQLTVKGFKMLHLGLKGFIVNFVIFKMLENLKEDNKKIVENTFRANTKFSCNVKWE